MENRCVPVNLSHNDMEKFYYRFSIDYSLFPYPQHPVSFDFWDSYVHVNVYTRVVMAMLKKVT